MTVVKPTKVRHAAQLQVLRWLAPVGTMAVTSAMTLALGLPAAPPANAAESSLEFCPYLPYLSNDSIQIVQTDYDWTLYQVDAGGHDVVLQQGRDRGCQVVSPAGNGVYRVGMRGDCRKGFHLTGTSPAIWVPEAPAQVHTRVDAQWSNC